MLEPDSVVEGEASTPVDEVLMGVTEVSAVLVEVGAVATPTLFVEVVAG